MENVVDLSDIKIKKNDITVFNKDCDNDKKEYIKESKENFMYKLLKTDGLAKRGEFETVHGTIQTPVFIK